jgi:glycosyltransferase involved in cell wall biosynthesis
LCLPVVCFFFTDSLSMPNNTLPRVSVVTATVNRPVLLKRALDSIAQQTFASYEALILDDGSGPETKKEYASFWSSFNDQFRLLPRTLPGEKGGSPAASRNRGIQMAKGEYIAFLDDDDQWIRSDHLQVGIAAMQEQGADYYFANMQAERNGKVVWPEWFPNSPQLTQGRQVSSDPPVYEVSLRNLMAVMRHHLIHPNCSIVRAGLLREVGGFCERVMFSEDYELMMRLADKAKRILYRPDCTVSYRLPEQDSHSLRFNSIEQSLDRLTATLNVRSICQNPLVRRCARAREAWSLREIAQRLRDGGHYKAALSFAWQALSIFPTLGASLFFARTLFKAGMNSLFGSQEKAVSEKRHKAEAKAA